MLGLLPLHITTGTFRNKQPEEIVYANVVNVEFNVIMSNEEKCIYLKNNYWKKKEFILKRHGIKEMVVYINKGLPYIAMHVTFTSIG